MATLHVAQDLINFFLPIGTIVVADRDISPASKWGGSWERINGYYLYAGAAFNKTNGTGKDAQGTAISVAQMPNHDHKTTTDLGCNGLILRWDNTSSGGAYWGTPYHDGNFQSSGAYALNTLYTTGTGGNQAHSHKISTCECYVWRRIS